MQAGHLRGELRGAVSHPVIIQGFRDDRDLISPIYLGRYDARMSRVPTVYFREYDGCQLYCIFHRMDWSNWWRPLRWLDEHEYDFEGFVLGPDFSAAIFHHIVVQVPYRADRAYIQPCGHGIRFDRIWGGNALVYTTYDIVDMDDPWVDEWLMNKVKPIFNKNGVQMYDQWHYGAFKNDPRSLSPHITKTQ